MGYHWSVLDLYGVSSSHELAELFLDSLLGKSLLEQLKARRIIQLAIKPFLFGGGICTIENLGFSMILNWPFQPQGNEYYATNFGHELFHTFQFNLDNMKPMWGESREELYKRMVNRIRKSKRYYRELENCAETFAFLWASYSDHRNQLEEFIDRFKNSVVDVQSL